MAMLHRQVSMNPPPFDFLIQRRIGIMEAKSKYYMLYKFNDGTSYKVEIGKDGVTEADMRCLRRMNKGCVKKEPEAVSLNAIISGEDKHSVLVDEGVETEIIVEEREELALLHKGIKKLPPEDQELLQQIFFFDVSARQYAKSQGLNRMKVNRRIKELLLLLKDFL
jgi:hypothetical protein